MDLCYDCSITLLGRDFSDFAGILTEELHNESYGALVHCDNCGDIYVDMYGKRIRQADEDDELETHYLDLNVDLRERK